MIDWEKVREHWRSGLDDLGRKKESYHAARTAGLVPDCYEVGAAEEKWWRDIVGNLFKRSDGAGSTEAICVQPGFWVASDTCGWDEHNIDWNRISSHGEAVAQKLALKATYMELRFGRGPQRLQPEQARRADLDYGDEAEDV